MISKFQDFLFPGGQTDFIIGFVTFLTHGQWFQDLFIHDVAAFNRLIMVVYPKAAFIFSRKSTIGIIISVNLLSYLIAWFANYYLPCCQFYFYYGSYYYVYVITGYNVANVFINTPINFIASGFAVVNYIIVRLYY